MKLAIAQLNSVVGAFDSNVKRILDYYQRACKNQARALITPELSVCGYPPYDLIERPEMIQRCDQAIETLRVATAQPFAKGVALIVGHVTKSPYSDGRSSQNSVSVIQDGKIQFTQAKSLLPTYDVFDEHRYFEAARSINLWNCDGTSVALAVCEDLWGPGPTEVYRQKGAQLVISMSASPYEFEKGRRRFELHQKIAQDLKIPLVYCNQIGATDEILFDGQSFVVGPEGGCITQLPAFDESMELVETAGIGDIPQWSGPREIAVLTEGLICGIREYFRRTGFKKAILGLSGGIDSAVVASLAVQALGREAVKGVAMPGPFSSSHSLSDAQYLADQLRIDLEIQPIKFSYSNLKRELSDGRGELKELALENLQARLRGLILMTLSNQEGSLVLTTGNKSELATGYCTLYGDMAGALAPIGDLYKTQVYEVAKWINSAYGHPIPVSTIEKAPSAELRPNQTDQDSLPPYSVLDAFLKDLIEGQLELQELESRHRHAWPKGPTTWISDFARLVELNEYKRRQAAPVLKVSPKAFGIGRRICVAKEWFRTSKR